MRRKLRPEKPQHRTARRIAVKNLAAPPYLNSPHDDRLVALEVGLIQGTVSVVGATKSVGCIIDTSAGRHSPASPGRPTAPQHLGPHDTILPSGANRPTLTSTVWGGGTDGLKLPTALRRTSRPPFFGRVGLSSEQGESPRESDAHLAKDRIHDDQRAVG